MNFDEWSAHLLHRLHRQIELTADHEPEALYDELAAYPNVRTEPPGDDASRDVLLPLQLRVDDVELSFFSTVTTFGTALDITFEELAIEAFYPADAATAAALRPETTLRPETAFRPAPPATSGGRGSSA